MLRPYSLLIFCLLAVAPAALHSQSVPIQPAGGESPDATNNDEGPAGIIPLTRGFNLSLGTTSQHDSSNGWSSVLTPDGAFRLNSHFAFDATAPIYTYLNVLTVGGTVLHPNQTYVTHHFLPGDVSLNGHFEVSGPVDYNLTTSVGFPTGSYKAGVGAGQVTYNINNHFEKTFNRFTPEIELGVGDTSSLVDERVRKSYTTVGELAHFQAGASVQLPRYVTLSANAYEELPIATTTVYSTTGRGKNKVTTAHTQGAAEDNGFLTSLDIPLQPHVILSGFYDRSLRSHIDTAGFSFTFLLKTAKSKTR